MALLPTRERVEIGGLEMGPEPSRRGHRGANALFDHIRSYIDELRRRTRAGRRDVEPTLQLHRHDGS
jgi:hypothetical protein